MAPVEPVPGAPAATVNLGGETGLAVADYHAGIEAGLRYERGVELDSAAGDRRERLLSLLERTRADRLVVVGDLAHRIPEPAGQEAEELSELLAAVTERVPVTVVPGNHDGGLEDRYGDIVDITSAEGIRIGDTGFVHGHTWPAPSVFAGDVVCVGHEHPTVRLVDDVGGSRVEPAWLRGRLRREVFADRVDGPLDWGDPELVVFPAFNDRSGGTRVNAPEVEFLSPFLPEAIESAEAYLLDGTRLGDYRSV